MKRFFYTLASVSAIAFCLTSCGGGGAKTVNALQKVVKSKVINSEFRRDAAKAIGRSGDNVASHISTKTVTCTTCAGLKQVDFIDDDGNYLYTGDCPDCDGEGAVTKYEFK